MSASEKKSSKKTKRARLGRGLGALIDQGSGGVVAVDATSSVESVQRTNNLAVGNKATEAAAPISDDQRVHELPIDAISPNPHQPRRVFDDQAISVLAESIKHHGLMQPVVVRRGTEAGCYELVAGERRLRATREAGYTTIKAILQEADDQRSAELALIENIQRADLNPIERAMGYKQLVDRFELTQQQLAERMGQSRSGVANLMRLLELDSAIQDHIARGELSTGHGKVLLSCESINVRSELALQCIEQGWTVRELEKYVTERSEVTDTKSVENNVILETPQNNGHDRVTSVLRDLERRMSEQLCTQVTLKTDPTGTKGRIQIDFYDLDQFDGLLTRLGVASEHTDL